MPALDETEYARNLGTEVKGTEAQPGQAVATAAQSGAKSDLIGLDALGEAGRGRGLVVMVVCDVWTS